MGRSWTRCASWSARSAYLVPLFVIGAGVALAARPHLRSPTRMRWGAIVLALGLTLGFAAGSFGLGPPGAAGHDLFNVDEIMDRGGIVGETLYWATSTLFSRAGAHLVFVFLVLGGILLLTGRSIGELVTGARARAADLARTAGSELQRARADARRPQRLRRARGRAAIEALHHAPDEDEPTGEIAAVAAEDQAFGHEEVDPLTRVEREIKGHEAEARRRRRTRTTHRSSRRRASGAPP